MSASSEEFQKKLESTLKTDPTKEVIADILRLLLFKRADKNEALLALIEVYDLVGFDRFVDLVSIFSGLTISFPSKEEFKETIQLAISYYYKTIEGKNWSEIKELMGVDDLPTIQLGIQIQSFQSFLQYIAERIRARQLRGE